MPIKNLCSKKNVTINKSANLRQAAQCMKEQHVGALIVIAEKGDKPIGILTDRDIVVNALASNKSMDTQVSEIMTSKLVSIPQNSGVSFAINKMEKAGVRRAVVLDEKDNLCGMISSDDLIQLLGSEMNSLGNLIGRQISAKSMAQAV